MFDEKEFQEDFPEIAKSFHYGRLIVWISFGQVQAVIDVMGDPDFNLYGRGETITAAITDLEEKLAATNERQR